MKDDSLSDVDQKYDDCFAKALEVAKANGATVHPRIADIKRAIELGDSVGKQENVYAKQIWNDALETAANNLAKWYPDNVSTNAFCAAIRSIRK